MVDPLTALGAVANITQFIEFAVKILTNSRNICASASGRLVEHEDLNIVTDDISNLTEKLLESLAVTAASNNNLTADEQALCDLCKECVKVSQELTQALEKLKSQDKPGKFWSFRQALKSMYRKDEIDNLDKRVKMYKEELSVRIVAGLWTKTDVLAIQQSEGFALLDENIRDLIQSQSCAKAEIEGSLERQTTVLTELSLHTEAIIEDNAQQNEDEHETLRTQITELSQQTEKQSGRALDAQAIVRTAIDLSIDQNLAEHNKTREEMKRLKEEAERQVEALTNEIRQLKIELEASVKRAVASMSTASKKEQQKLKETSNAKFNLWVAKELILEKLKAFIALFRFNFAVEVWPLTTDFKSWKFMPYPKPSQESICEPLLSPKVASDIEEGSMAYFHVDIYYPIAARNVPMVKMCLDQGIDVNQTISGPIPGETPLIKAVATAYEYTKFDTIATRLLMRRESRKMIQLLLEYGADLGQLDGSRSRAGYTVGYIESKDSNILHTNRPDWLIQELVKPVPHDDFRRLLSMTEAAWAGDSKRIEVMVAEDAQICRLADRRGVSPLGVAALRGDEHMMTVLLDQGASPDAIDPIGSSPLAISMMSERADVVKLLVQRGASLEISDSSLGLTPLQYAVREGNRAMCDAMLMNRRTKNETSTRQLLSKLFATAVQLHRIDEVKLLLDYGADASIDLRKFLKDPEFGHEFSAYGIVTPLTFVQIKLRLSIHSLTSPPEECHEWRFLSEVLMQARRIRRSDLGGKGSS